jgi:hypothetical protein
VITLQQLAKSNNYTQLKQNLFSNNKAEVILSTVLIQELEAKHLIDISAEEKKENGYYPILERQLFDLLYLYRSVQRKDQKPAERQAGSGLCANFNNSTKPINRIPIQAVY